MNSRGWATHWLRINAATTVYAAIGFTSAGLATLLCGILQIDRTTALCAGFLTPIGPTFLHFASTATMTRRLETISGWQMSGLITEKDAEQLRERALRWYGDRLFGIAEVKPDENLGSSSEASHPVPHAVGTNL